AEMSHGAFDELSDGAGVAHIGGNGKGLPSGGGDAAGQGVQGLFVPGGQDHVGSGPHELPGRGGADTAAGAGDETDRAVQWTFGHCPVLSLVLARYPQRRRRRLRGSWNAVTTNQISPPKRTTGVRTTSGGKTSMRVLSIPTPAITRPVTASGRGSSRRITDGTETPASNRANGTVNPAEPKPKENVESILATAGSIMGATCAAVQPVSPLKARPVAARTPPTRPIVAPGAVIPSWRKRWCTVAVKIASGMEAAKTIVPVTDATVPRLR